MVELEAAISFKILVAVLDVRPHGGEDNLLAIYLTDKERLADTSAPVYRRELRLFGLVNPFEDLNLPAPAYDDRAFHILYVKLSRLKVNKNPTKTIKKHRVKKS